MDLLEHVCMLTVFIGFKQLLQLWNKIINVIYCNEWLAILATAKLRYIARKEHRDNCPTQTTFLPKQLFVDLINFTNNKPQNVTSEGTN